MARRGPGTAAAGWRGGEVTLDLASTSTPASFRRYLRSGTVGRVSPLPAALRPLVRAELERLCASRGLASAALLVRLLRHLVERHLDGDLAALRETALALEVFGRDPRTWDAQTDPIVRVTTRRLRAQLDRIYTDGAHPQVRIRVPTGRYLPEYEFRSAGENVDRIAVTSPRNATGDRALDASCATFARDLGERLARAGVPGGLADAAHPADWELESTLTFERTAAGSEARWTLRLVRAGDRAIAWTGSRSAPLAERDRAAAEVVDAAVAQIAAMRALPDPVGDAEAPAADAARRELIDAARLLLWQQSPSDAGDAQWRAERATERFPDAADAWAILALALFARMRANAGRDPALRARFAAAALRAHGLDGGNADVLHARALAWLHVEHRPADAVRALGRALRVAPNHLPARVAHADALRLIGAGDRALAELEVALASAPLAPCIRAARARQLEALGRFDEAREEWSLLRVAGEGAVTLDLGLGRLEARAGRYERARGHARAAAQRQPERPEPLALLALIEAAAGERAAAHALDAELARRFPAQGRTTRGLVAARLGDCASAVAHLRAAFDDGDPALLDALVDPDCAPIAGDPAFVALLRDTGLADRAAPADER